MAGFAVSVLVHKNSPVGFGYVDSDTGEYRRITIQEAKDLQRENPEALYNVKEAIGSAAIPELDRLPKFDIETKKVNKNIFTIIYKNAGLYYISDYKGELTITSSLGSIQVSNAEIDGTGDFLTWDDEVTQEYKNKLLLNYKLKFITPNNKLKVIEDMTGEDLAMPEGITGFTSDCWAVSGELRALQLPVDMHILAPNSFRGLTVNTLVLPVKIKLSAMSFTGCNIDRVLIQQGVIVEKGAFNGARINKFFGNALAIKQIRGVAPAKSKFYGLGEYDG